MAGTTSRGYPFATYGDLIDFPTQIQDLAEAVDTDMEALWDRLVAGNNQAACRVRAAGVNQSVANNTDVAASFAEELYDNAAMVDLGTSATTINITQTGTYIAVGRVSFAAGTTGTGRQISIVSSGTLGTVARKSLGDNTLSGSVVPVNLTTLFWAASGTTLQLIMRQNSGAALNTTTRTMMVAKTGVL